MEEHAYRVSRRLRPMRFGFRVDPRSADDLARAIEPATAHWGGIFDPMIPAFRARPPWWHGRVSGPTITARSIEAAYIEAFAPDHIVDARKGVSSHGSR